MSAKLGQENVFFVRHPDGFWLLGWGALERLKSPHPRKPSFFLAEFFPTANPRWWVFEHSAQWTTPELLRAFPELNHSQSGAREWQSPSPHDYAADFAEVMKAIESGSVQKAVPIATARSSGPVTRSDFFAWWQRTLKIPSRWLAYGLWTPEEGLLGLSPEILFLQEEGLVTTMALAGTAAATDPSLLESEKDRREHQWVVDDICAQLHSFGNVQVTPTREWPIGTLKHLRTDMALRTDARFEDLVQALHPTAALGVAPRAAGLELLRSLKSGQERKYFGAPMGVAWPDVCDLAVVAIRGVEWRDHELRLSSGGGVVAGSDLDREWSELALKRQVVRDQLGV